MNKEITNVAIICHDHCLSGANKSLLDWITTSDRKKYKIICVIPRKNKQFEEICQKNNIELIIGNYFVTVKHLYKLPIEEKIKNLVKNLLRICINPISFFILKNKLEKRNIKLIHSNSFATTFGVKLAIKMKIPHIWHVREFMEEDHKITHYESKNKIKKYCGYSNAIFISDVIKSKYDELFVNGIKRVIYDKVNFDEKYTKKRKLLEDDKCNILIAGTLSPNKNQIEALKILEELIKRKYNNIMLYICGIGDNEKYLKNYVSSNKLKDVVKFMGQVENLTDFRKNIDIELVCSKSEALGRVTIEAMYYKNLVIGCNKGCTPYIIDNKKTGFLYECGNYSEAANIIASIINNKTNYIKVIEEAQKEAVKKYYNIDYSKEIFEVYYEVMKGIKT